ncbi:MAG: mannose-1-phosphate guanylyltransferase/mannose-6-phosphate isomerase [Syntrophobacteraceae bacterium]
MIVPIILAGGSGTRLWPFSRELYPKQLLSLVDERTMLQNTVLRLQSGNGVAGPVVICNENHRFLVAEQLRVIGVKPSAIILEPVGRNTAPAIAIGALNALAMDPASVLLVLPADHHIRNREAFQDAVKTAERFASMDHLVTFGIVPDSPETGYGYIQKGQRVSTSGESEVFRIGRFVEKPDQETAQRYIDSGDYCWNSGMFVFRASQVIKELEHHAPEMVEACREAYGRGVSDLDFYRLNGDAFSSCPSDSIDYAVMEKTREGVMIPLDAGWSDLGSWEALWEIGRKDDQANVIHGDVLTHDVESCYINASSRLVAAVGIRGHIIVETADAVFVSPRDKAQEVKALVGKLKTQKREEALTHSKVYRPWGAYEGLNEGNRFQVKRITVKPGAVLSLQKHHHRAEHWIVVHGTALVTRGDETFLLKEDESTYIPLGTRHRLENPGKIPLELIEVQSGSYLGEDDIVRFEDLYGRHVGP